MQPQPELTAKKKLHDMDRLKASALSNRIENSRRLYAG